jgi:hypothetical protein
VWTDLHSGNTGTMKRTGDPGQPDSPSFSRDGAKVAYTSTTNGPIGIYEAPADTDIYTIPYANHAGGTATPLPGASDPAYNEYYPTYSPGDSLLAYNRIGATQQTYNAADAEVFVLPGEGGQATRLAANDPPRCSNVTSPGITNSWPRWAPQSAQIGSKRYYWVVFSSTRRANPSGADPLPQLFLSAIVTTVNGGAETIDKTYPAIYVTTQVPTEANHTPAWDTFNIVTTRR